MSTATASVLEPAIPEHLATERTLPSNLPPNYQPPFPAYAARFPKSSKGLVMAVIGLQKKTEVSYSDEDRKKLIGFISQRVGEVTPQHWGLAAVVDKEGYRNIAAIAYWKSVSEHNTWIDKSGFGDFWKDLQPAGGIGWFMEVFSPSMDRLETVFSDNNVPEGIAHMRESVSGPLQEHVYWGSMRDRLPASQTDALDGDQMSLSKEDKVLDAESKRIRVAGRKNLAMIRSGQDWSNTSSHERELYLKTMHPVLIKGMEFLTHEGSAVGCFSNRFMEVVNIDGSSEPTDKTFGLGYFDDMASLEGWSKQHKTHLDIFGRFIQYAAELQNHVQLRLFHEVMVLQPEQQFFEYVGCHPGTGMLASL
jgi:hypothetical protein